MSDIARKFLGTWRFVSAVQRYEDGSERPNPGYGPNAAGYIVYTEAGRMMVFIMDLARPRWESEARPTEAELRSAMNGFLTYAGRYEVNAAEGFVLHHIEMDRIPNRVGTTVKRYFVFDAAHMPPRLVLRAAEPQPAGVVDYRITWERVEG